MSRKSAAILDDDEEMDVFEFMLEALGYDYNTLDVQLGKNLIEPENIKKNLAVLLKMVENRQRRSAYFAIGYLFMSTGFGIPNNIKLKVLEASNFMHERKIWSDKEFALKRKVCLEDFSRKINAHQEGKRFFPISPHYNRTEITKCITHLEELRQFSGNVKKIHHINLGGWDLKEVPNEISNFSFLKSLNLENNQIEKLPNFIGKLKDLELLYVGNNELEILPDSIGNLQSLKEIDISNNPISSLPLLFRNLKFLKYIYVRGTGITKAPEFLKISHFDNLNYTIYL